MSMMSYDYDLLVIGAGSAGLAAARRSASYGVKVAIVEQEQLGGVCTNRGCVPKKLMVYAASFSRQLTAAQDYGWSMPVGEFSWQRFVQARDQAIDQIHQSQQQSLEQAGIELIRGHAAFIDPHTVSIDRQSSDGQSSERNKLAQQKVRADKILVAVGGKPNKPPISGIEYALTSREMFHLQELPGRLAILGGGYIGVEFASLMRGLGVDVSVLDQSHCVLSGFDQDLQIAVRDGLRDRGINIFCSTTAESIQPTSQGLELTLAGEGLTADCPDTLAVDTVLCATGRSPNLNSLKLENAGVDVSRKQIVVDDYSQTSQENVYAVGDCTNRLPLTPVARAEGHAFADTVFGNQPRKLDYGLIPSAVFSRPEAATVGMTEAQARECYSDPFSNSQGNDEAIYCNLIEFTPLFDRLTSVDRPALFKQVIHRASDRVLGVHLVCEHAAEMIQGIALAMQKGVTKQEMDHTIGIHPTSIEELFE